MATEVLLYDFIFSQSAKEFINTLEENKEEDIVVRINTDGGSPEYGWGMINKFAEHPGAKKVKVDGKAYSMGSFFLAYADEVEASDVSQFLIHRAAYPSWFEENMSEELRENLNNVNASLKKAIRAKIDESKLKSLKGVSLNDIFSNDSRKDVFLNASEAKAIGLVNKITKLTPAKKAEIDFSNAKIAAQFAGSLASIQPTESPKIENMTLEELKENHPEAYAAAVAEGAENPKKSVIDKIVEKVASVFDSGENTDKDDKADETKEESTEEANEETTEASTAEDVEALKKKLEAAEQAKKVAEAKAAAYEAGKKTKIETPDPELDGEAKLTEADKAAKQAAQGLNKSLLSNRKKS